MRSPILLAPLLLLSCRPEASVASDYSPTTGDLESETLQVTETIGESTTGNDGTTIANTTTPEPTDADGTTASTDDGACEPPISVLANFALTPGDRDVSADCLVGVSRSEPTAFDLYCGSEQYRLALLPPGAGATIGLSDGLEVRLEYRTEVHPQSDSRWIAVKSTDGQTIVGGVSGAKFDPPGEALGAFFGTPNVIEASAVCAPVESFCGQSERVAIDVYAYEGAVLRLFDGGYVNDLESGIEIRVESAIYYYPSVECIEQPGADFDFVFTRVPVLSDDE